MYFYVIYNMSEYGKMFLTVFYCWNILALEGFSIEKHVKPIVLLHNISVLVYMINITMEIFSTYVVYITYYILLWLHYMLLFICQK